MSNDYDVNEFIKLKLHIVTVSPLFNKYKIMTV